MGKPLENNRAHISGMLLDEFKFSHEMYGEKFYESTVVSERASGVSDYIPITVSERIAAVKGKWAGQHVEIFGSFRSYNRGNHLILHVFVDSIGRIAEDSEDDANEIFLDGFICREVKYRETPLGRELSEVMLAVNRDYGKSDYVPCIVWSRNARFASGLSVGTRLRLYGRIQSREYQKWIDDETVETRTCYEVSASKIEVVEESEGEENGNSND